METTTAEVLSEAEEQLAEIRQMWIAFGIALGIIIVLTVIILLVCSKHNRCWPFKYGGFTEKNGYRDVKYWHDTNSENNLK